MLSKLKLSRTRAIMLSFAAITCATAPALAASWKTATWGRAWVTVTSYTNPNNPFELLQRVKGQTDDLKEDGYCVYLRSRGYHESWPGTVIPGTKSCGAIKAFDVRPVIAVGVRLYREDGRYLTLSGS